MELVEKLKDCFDEMLVYKDLKKTNFFSSLSLPAFMRDWLLKKFEDEDGNFDKEELSRFVKKFIPRKDDWNAIKNRIIIEKEKVKFLAKVSINIDIKTGEVSFALPDFGLNFKETINEPDVWERCKDDLFRGQDIWGMVELGYRAPDDFDFEFEYEKKSSKSRDGKQGKIKLVSFKNFCPYNIDLDEYKEARKEFETSEWIDVVLGAVDYNASGYKSEEEKLTMLTRLLPFVEKRLNLIELAPKGTGKSYLFGNVSRFGWLSSGGVMSRAKLFYDQSMHGCRRSGPRCGPGTRTAGGGRMGPGHGGSQERHCPGFRGGGGCGDQSHRRGSADPGFPGARTADPGAAGGEDRAAALSAGAELVHHGAHERSAGGHSDQRALGAAADRGAGGGEDLSDLPGAGGAG